MSELPFTGPLREHYDLKRDLIHRAKSLLRRTPTRVMVFGPGQGRNGHRKRLQIRDRLNSLEGVTAFFPEEDWVASAAIELGVSATDVIQQEDLLADFAHTIVALEMSQGVRDEVARYASRATIAHKVFTLVQEKYKAEAETTYPGKLRKHLKKHYYTPEEFQSCALARGICVHHVRSVQISLSLEGV